MTTVLINKRGKSRGVQKYSSRRIILKKIRKHLVIANALVDYISDNKILFTEYELQDVLSTIILEAETLTDHLAYIGLTAYKD